MNVPPQPIANFIAALQMLERFAVLDLTDEVNRTAVIQAFEFTFETAWKAERFRATAAGMPVSNPRAALQAAVSLGHISPSNEQTWLDMLADRNLTVHTYSVTLADAMSQRIRARYLGAFQDLKGKL